MHIGFAVVSRQGEIEFRLFGAPEARRRWVSCSRGPDGWAVLLGRLRYRADLTESLRTFGGAAPAPTCDSDAALALETYRTWGAEGFSRLEGDFSLTIWDRRRGLLYAARDSLGGWPLFWIERPGLFAVGNRLNDLVGLSPGRALDLDYVADFLMLPRALSSELRIERTVYSGVKRVMPGAFVRHEIHAGRTHARPYWDWQERTVESRTEDWPEVSRRYGGLLREAVRERVDGTTGAHLSGGMDSTAVACLARDVLAADGRKDALPVFSLVFTKYRHLAHETLLLERVLEAERGLAAHRLAADELTSFQIFCDPPPHAEPWPALGWCESDFALSNAALAAGVSTLLTGHGADEMVSVPPYHLADMLRRGHFRAARAEAVRWAAVMGQSWWNILRRYGLPHLVPARVRPGLEATLRGGYAGFERMNAFTVPPWIARPFARQYDLRGRGIRNIRSISGKKQPLGLSMALSAISNRTGDSVRWYHAAPRGLATAHPFLDPRLLCFCLGVRARADRPPIGDKRILADALRGVVPEIVLNREKKGHFNEPYFRGFARAQARLESLIENSAAVELGLVDRDVLLRCVRATALGVCGDAAIVSRLFVTLAFLQWLARHDEWSKLEAPPAEIFSAATSASPEETRAAPV